MGHISDCEIPAIFINVTNRNITDKTSTWNYFILWTKCKVDEIFTVKSDEYAEKLQNPKSVTQIPTCMLYKDTSGCLADLGESELNYKIEPYFYVPKRVHWGPECDEVRVLDKDCKSASRDF